MDAPDEILCPNCGDLFLRPDDGRCPTCAARLPNTTVIHDAPRVVAVRQPDNDFLVKFVRTTFDPLLQDEDARLIGDVIVEAGLLAGSMTREADRAELRKAITKLAHAEGLAGTREALIYVAAVALAWAGSIPPVQARDPRAVAV